MSHAELALLGHLIGDGCTLPRRSIQYTTREIDLAHGVVALAREVFGDEVRPYCKRERTWFQVYLPTTRAVTHGVRNPVSVWLEELGVWGRRSHEKRVPTRVFAQPSDAICVFLRHLWATDGCVRMAGRRSRAPAVYYATSSEGLARDVQALLLRIEVNATLRTVPQARGRTQYHVAVSGRREQLRFADLVGAAGAYRCASLAEIVEHLSGRAENTNRDVLPAEVWDRFVRPAMAEAGLTHRALHTAIGMAYSGMTIFKQNVSRERAARVASAVGSEALATLARSDVYWDRITRIAPAGEEQVYDLTVPGAHNFVAGEVIVHNSIEQDADKIVLLHRPEYYEPDKEELKGKATVIVAKNRNGPTGEVEMHFHKSQMRFETLTRM